MDKAALHQQVTHLIGQDELGQAAELLAQHWQAQHEPLYQATLAQIRRLHTLEQKQLKGLVSEDNANVEHARITDALLSLSGQLLSDRPGLPEQWEEIPGGATGRPKWWLPAGLIALVVVIALIWAASQGKQPDTFNLTLNLQEEKDATPVSGGQVKIILGDYHLDAKEVNNQGQVIFNEIPGKYLQDSLKVIPVNLRYSVASVSPVIPRESQNITVRMISRPDSTLWRGRVVNLKNQIVPRVQIDVESGLALDTSDNNGNFRITVPLPNNSAVQVVLRIDGEVRYDKQNIISKDVPSTLIINDPK